MTRKLIVLLSANDHREAVADLVPDLVAFARNRGLQQCDAEDVAQEVALRALQQPMPDSRRGLRSLCYRIVRTVIIDGHRKSGADANRIRHAGASLTAPRDVADDVAELDQMALAVKTLAELPERYRTVIVGLDMHERSVKELADELGLTEANVRQVRSRAHKALRKNFTAAGGSAAVLLGLFPMLRQASRLRYVAAGLIIPMMLLGGFPSAGGFPSTSDSTTAGGSVGVGDGQPIHHVPTVGYGTGSGAGMAGSADADASRARAALAQQHLLGYGLLPTVPTCPPNPGKLTICRGNLDDDPNAVIVGVNGLPMPVPCTPQGCPPDGMLVEVEPGDVPVADVCGQAPHVPYVVCQRGGQ